VKKVVSKLRWSLLQYMTGLFVIATLLLPASAFSQVAGTGTVQGTVSDATGAVISNAKVTLTETSTQVARNTQTDGSGIYVFPNIAIGTYSLQVANAGFETFTESNIVLEVGSNISINVKMTVGAATQKVEVRSEGLALQTDDVAYKQTIDSAEILEMPLNGRQLTGLLQFSGGIASAGGNDFTGSKYSYQAVAISVAGGMGNDTLWRLDGADNSDYMAGANLPFPFPDAVAQFSVESSALGAQNGMHAGGMVNVVTRSGTNTFHGSGFEFIRNNLIDATGFYVLPCVNGAVPPNCGKDTLHQDQYGGTFGGPVWIPKLYNGKDKFFFFTAFQYTRSKSESASSFGYVPTAANILLGNYQVEAGVPTNAPGTGATVGTAPNSLCGTKITQLLDPVTGTPLPGNAYATGTLPTWNPQSLALLKYYPYTSATAYTLPPLADGSDICGHIQYTIPNANFDKQFITRIDYSISSHDHLYGRYMLDTYQLPAYFYPNNIAVTTFSGNPEQRVQTGTIGEDHTFTSNLVNSAHIAVLRRLNDRGYSLSDINGCSLGVIMTCGVPHGLYFGTGGQDGIPGLGGGTNSLAHFNDNTLAVDDDVTWLHGRHQFVFGGEFVRNQLNISNAYLSNGEFGFGTNYSEYGPYGTQKQSALNGNYCPPTLCPSGTPAMLGDGQLDFLEGAMNSWSQSKQQQNALRSPVPSLYIQDTFHMTKQLTLVAGLRWDPFFQPIDVFNRGVNFNAADFLANIHSSVYPTAPAGMLFYGDPGVLQTFTQSSPNEWDPNFGFTYDPVGNGKTVLRAGAEYMYDTPNNFTTQRNQQNPPFATAVGQSLNSYIPFSNPWSAPSLPSNAGPGATNAASVIGNPFPTGASFVGTPSASNALFPNNSQYIVPVAQFHPAVYAQWTASIQHDFGRGWLATITYIGNKGTHEEYGTPLNPPVFIPGVSSGTAGSTNCNVAINGTNYWLGEFAASSTVPAAGALCSTTGNEAQRSVLIMENPAQGNLIGNVNSSVYVSDTSISTYEGMVVSVNHRLSSTFSLLANYTWSKCLDIEDNQGDVSGITVENVNIPRWDYGPCGFDYRNVLSVAPILKSAFHFNNNTESFILNNWEFSGLSKITTGSNFSVTTGSDDDEIGNPGGDRATRIQGVPLYAKVKFRQASGASNRQYLNPAAFQTSGSYYTAWETASATAPVYGNTGRNAFHAPPLINFDGQISRFWQLHERLTMLTRIEAYNALNHPSFGSSTSNVTSGTFGQISGTANGARVFQGVLKFTF
jgi:hypothetical protein